MPWFHSLVEKMRVFWCKIEIHFMKDLDKGCLFVRGQFWDVLQQNLACDNAIQFLERFRTCEESYAKS